MAQKLVLEELELQGEKWRHLIILIFCNVVDQESPSAQQYSSMIISSNFKVEFNTCIIKSIKCCLYDSFYVYFLLVEASVTNAPWENKTSFYLY